MATPQRVRERESMGDSMMKYDTARVVSTVVDRCHSELIALESDLGVYTGRTQRNAELRPECVDHDSSQPES